MDIKLFFRKPVFSDGKGTKLLEIFYLYLSKDMRFISF